MIIIHILFHVCVIREYIYSLYILNIKNVQDYCILNLKSVKQIKKFEFSAKFKIQSMIY